jgi:alpha-ketoglutarate-dependent taurine dioxygenase
MTIALVRTQTMNAIAPHQRAYSDLQAAYPSIRLRSLRSDEATGVESARDLVLVMEPTGAPDPELLEHLFTHGQDALRALIAHHGAVLLRGFDVDRPRFDRLVSGAFAADRHLWMFPAPPAVARGLLHLPVVGWIVRRLLGWIEASAIGRDTAEDTMSKLADDPTIQFPHHEFGIFFNVPKTLAFYCEEEAGSGGETSICDARAAYQDLSESLRHQLERASHIRYRDQNQWYLPPFTAPAVLRHPDDGTPTMNFTAERFDIVAEVVREMFPEQSVTAPDHDETYSFASQFVDRDGQAYELTDEEQAELLRAHFARCVLLRWQRQDILLLDNFRTIHGRMSSGSPRKILHVMLCDHVRNDNHFTLWPRPRIAARDGGTP